MSPGEYPFDPASLYPGNNKSLTHIINFNDLDSVLYVLKRYPIACIILEPVLQNIGVVKPGLGYLEGLRTLADEHGFLLIFDEVKTGFRHALGGFQGVCGVTPDLSTFGKAVANGYPMGVIGGKKVYMDYFIHPAKEKRVLIAGTFNAHPLITATAIATLQKLSSKTYNVYQHVNHLGQLLENGLNEVFTQYDRPFYIARQSLPFAFILWIMPPSGFP